jgi:hypothetical protein
METFAGTSANSGRSAARGKEDLMLRKGRRGMTVAVLAALLAAPLGVAEAAGGTAARETEDVWSRLAGWLWAQAESVTVFWEGSSIGPFGQPGSAQSDAGSSIDPWGQPSSAQSDLGAYIDPHG